MEQPCRSKSLPPNNIGSFPNGGRPSDQLNPKEKHKQQGKTVKRVAGRKRCTKCLKIYGFKSFYKAKFGKHGLQSVCKNCQNSQIKKWAKTKKGKSSKKASCKKYRTSNHGKIKRSEYRKSDAGKKSQLRWRNSPKGKRYSLKYSTSDKRKSVSKRHYENGKGKASNLRYSRTQKGIENLARGVHKRRSRLSNVISDLTADQWLEIKLRQKFRCAICGRKKSLTRDHIIPISKGGHHTASNIQGLCRPCNSRKGNR